jgi:hypothetical protein
MLLSAVSCPNKAQNQAQFSIFKYSLLTKCSRIKARAMNGGNHLYDTTVLDLVLGCLESKASLCALFASTGKGGGKGRGKE